MAEYGNALRAVNSMSLESLGSYAKMANAVSNLTPKQQFLALSTRGLSDADIFGGIKRALGNA